MNDWNTMTLPELYAAAARTGLVRRLIELARDEDLGVGGKPGDVTSACSIDERAECAAKLVCRTGGVIAGLAAVGDMCGVIGPRVRTRLDVADGARVSGGAVLGELTGPMREVLACERTVLNLVSRLSGVATRTAEFAERMRRGGPVRAELFDTRKTTPGLRVLEKYAVRCGGGRCHRMGLYDAVLIKDNHLAGVSAAGLGEHVAQAAARARSAHGGGLAFVEVEVDNLEQLRSIIAFGARGGAAAERIDMVLLDNMPTAELREAVRMRDAAGVRIELEASGGVTLDTVRAIAETGVERISCGSLTHHAVWLDIALDIER